MAETGLRRRTLLGTAVGLGSTAISGCLGLGGETPECGDDGAAVLLRSQLRGWYVSYSVTERSDESAAAARRLAEFAESDGYLADYYFSSAVRNPNDEWQVELYGELDRESVSDLVVEASMPQETEITERSTTLSRGSGFKWPWSPGLLDGRASFLAENAPTIGVALPTFSAMSGDAVALESVPNTELLDWLQSVLSARGVLDIVLLGVPDDGNALNEFQTSNFVNPSREDPFFRARGATLGEEGTVETTLGIGELLKTVFRPALDENLRYADQARLRVSLDGEVIQERPLSQAERSYLRAYETYVIDDGPKPSEPNLSLQPLESRRALRTATLLEYPEAARFGITIDRC